MVFRPRQKTSPDIFPIIVDNKVIAQKDTAKLLGVYLDNHLSWDEHINNLMKKINFGLLLLYKLRLFLSQKQLLMVYHAFIQSHVSYACLVWGPTYKHHLCRIKVAQNKALRIMQFLPPLSNVDHLFEQFGIMDIYSLVRYKICLTAWMLHTSKIVVPSIKLVYARGHHGTRGHANLNLISYNVRNNFGNLHFLQSAFHLWNKLPYEVRAEPKLTLAKVKLKKLACNVNNSSLVL